MAMHQLWQQHTVLTFALVKKTGNTMVFENLFTNLNVEIEHANVMIHRLLMHHRCEMSTIGNHMLN